ncbi:hypothetical protein G7Y89_g10965 [Cudoniella acicularis]|uniref:Inner centromere protein ARK-binding domain-containing protein n=1 Tax=Cudoniella acicularis TaxID=354080 RepID=A0A8H4RE28_9HELO|nr:hypothetical protein G7Y89_g10965 [Cudoniella acicularis]
MATMRANSRLQVGSTPWITEERSSALQIAEAEAEEFAFSARNDIEWLNEHMAEIFSENNVNVAEIFKTPGKLRGKTPRTARKINPLESRLPLSDVFSATPRGAVSPFKQTHFERPAPTFQVAEDEPSSPEQPKEPEQQAPVEASPTRSPIHRKPVANHFDSGYFGSQLVHATQATEPAYTQPTQEFSPPKIGIEEPISVEDEAVQNRESEGSFQSAKEELSGNLPDEMEIDTGNINQAAELETSIKPLLESPLQSKTQPVSSPQKCSPQRSPEQSPKRSPERPRTEFQSPPRLPQPIEEVAPIVEDEPMDDVQSPSDGSSPIRPIVVRKSSLNFASLPAREPLTTKKSLGNRTSRTSHLEQARTSYYGRVTGGKSLGTSKQDGHDRDEDDMDVDTDENEAANEGPDSKIARLHNKTSTQRLQDQISMLGQSQSHARPASKSIAGTGLITSLNSQIMQVARPEDVIQKTKSPQRSSPQRKERPPPGAFPDDEEDSWIGPPTVAPTAPSIFSPRPQLPKSHSADVMEGVHAKDSIGGSQFNIPKRGDDQRQRSPIREPIIPERTTSTLGHFKSVSTSALRSPKKAGDSPGHKKGISVSNPNPSIHEESSNTPPKITIAKLQGGLFASSAAVSAEAKTSTLSPPSTRSAIAHAPSFEDVLSKSNGSLYPILDSESGFQHQPHHAPKSPPKASARKTRASTEREERRKEEEAREAREAKDAQKMADQLEKARLKVKEEARIYHQEQERVAAMQKEVNARKQEQQAKASQVEIPRATRSSPRKTKAQLEAEGIAAAAASADDVSSRDLEMTDSSTMPPPALPRPKSQIGRPGPKRPLRPAKETVSKPKPPTVIRVDTGSQRGHQYHPSNSTLAATLQESLSAPSGSSSQNTLRKKASTSSIQSKASTTSFKATATRALEAAARKKEQDELAAQRKREAKLEVERQRAAIKEEERRKEEQQRKQEAERQREIQRERERVASAADAKKAASRQAAEKRRQELEKAKQTPAPPPAARNLPEKALPPVPSQRSEFTQPKQSRIDQSTHRPQEDLGRPPNSVLHTTTKAPLKRPLQQDFTEEAARPGIQRDGPSHHEQHSKRRKTSEGFDDEDMTENHPKMTAPPIRQSSSRPKVNCVLKIRDFQADLRQENQPKSLFPSGYANAPSNNLQRSTIISQHNMNQSKPAHPMDMAQVSKAPISFASSSSQAKAQPYKTPARPVGKANAKSAAKSSPQYQNGENIDLPEIHTDSESEDSDAGDKPGFATLDWANSPALRDQLARQEPMDPAQIFGNPGPINMEEVFNKSKDKFTRFRDRTSSANWGGIDRLTEDEIRKDLEARDKLRRQGGWSYDSMV